MRIDIQGLLKLAPQIFVLAFASASFAAKADDSDFVALVNAHVLNATFDNLHTDQTVVLREGYIASVGPTEEIGIPSGARIIDISGKTVIPGLWDAHVHTRYAGIDHLRLLLLHGVTTLRDLGGPWDHVTRLTQWREEVAKGDRIAPTIWTGGTILNNPGADWSHITVVSNPQEAVEAVQRLKSAGADFVKVYSHLSRENYFAIVDEAARQNLPFDGHVPFSVSPEEASNAGQRVIEHIDSLVEPLANQRPDLDERGRPSFASLVGHIDPRKAKDLAEIFKANSTYVVPTVALSQHFSDAAQGKAGVVENPALRFIPAPYLQIWRANNRPRNPEQGKARAVIARQVTLELHRNGVPILAGTDTVKPFFVPGDALHTELAMLVEAGLTEGEALRAATLTPAEMMGIEKSGLIEAGFVADMLVLNGNPLEDISNTRSISMVVRSGHILDRSMLNQMADDIEAEAASWSGVPSGRDR